MWKPGSPFVAAALLAAAGLAAGCDAAGVGHGAGGSGGQAGKAAGAGGRGGGPVSCADLADYTPPSDATGGAPAPCGGGDYAQYPKLLAASEVGPDVRFVQISGSHILAERSAGAARETFVITFMVVDPGATASWRRSDLPDGSDLSIRALGLGDRFHSVVLACSSTACALLVVGEGPSLDPLPGVESPPGADWTSVTSATDAASSGVAGLCLLAPLDRMVCWDGAAWRDETPPASPIPPELCCPVPAAELFAVVTLYPESNLAVTSTGVVLIDWSVRHGRGACCAYSPPLGRPIGFEPYGCGLNQTALVLTVDALYGNLACLID